MENLKRRNIYIDLVNQQQVNNFGISYVEIKKLNNGNSISIDSSGRLLITSIKGFKVIENEQNYFILSSLVEENYRDVVSDFEVMDLKIEDVIDLNALIRIILKVSPYWSEMAYEWLVECPNLNMKDFKSEMDNITKSFSHTLKFRRRVGADLSKLK